MARKPHSANKIVTGKLEEAHRKYINLAMEEVSFPIMGLVDKVFGEQEARFRRAVSDPRWSDFYSVPEAKWATVVVPFYDVIRPTKGDVSRVITQGDYAHHFGGGGECPLDAPDPPYTMGLSLHVLYPEGVTRAHHSHYIPYEHSTIDRRGEAFLFTPGNVGKKLYDVVAARMRTLYDLKQTLIWQREFAGYFLGTLATSGQILAVWPEMVRLLGLGWQDGFMRNKATSMPPAMRKLIKEQGVDVMYINSVLEEIVNVCLTSELLEVDDPMKGEEAVLGAVQPVYIEQNILNINS